MGCWVWFPPSQVLFQICNLEESLPLRGKMRDVMQEKMTYDEFIYGNGQNPEEIFQIGTKRVNYLSTSLNGAGRSCKQMFHCLLNVYRPNSNHGVPPHTDRGYMTLAIRSRFSFGTGAPLVISGNNCKHKAMWIYQPVQSATVMGGNFPA